MIIKKIMIKKRVIKILKSNKKGKLKFHIVKKKVK